MTVDVRPMVEADWPAVSAIYGEGIATGAATFETEVPTWEAFDVAHLPNVRVVAVDNGTGAVLGWAAASPAGDRCVYGGVAEHGVYVTASARGRRVGSHLLGALIEASEDAGIWTLQSGIFPENEPSLALHRACGFRVVGRRERIAQLHGRWRDLVWVERRSPCVGIDEPARTPPA